MRFMVRASLACVPALSQMKVGDQPRRAIARASGAQSGAVSVVVIKGAVALFPAGGELDVGEMAVKDAGPGLPPERTPPGPASARRPPLRHPPPRERAYRWPKSMQGIKRSSRVHSSSTSSRSPQLVDLAHGLGTQGDVAEALAVAGPDHLPQGAEGCVQRLPTGALHQGAGVDHNPGGPPSDWPPGRRR